MSNFPPFPPTRATAAGRYSPSQPYSETAAPYGTSPPAARDHQSSYAYPPPPAPTLPPPPPQYRAYDTYDAPPRSAYAYEQPRRSFETNTTQHYDPYSPAQASYDPGTPALRMPPQPPLSTSLPSIRTDTYSAPSAAVSRVLSPPQRTAPLPDRRPIPSRDNNADSQELSLITQPQMMTVGNYTTAMHALPPSHLPIVKYVTLSRDDALDVHRQLCMRNEAVWYADGAARAGEGWSAAVEWIIESGRSGSKMRGALDGESALNAEIGGICKAAEGFQERLHQSIKDATPINHELVVFSSSQAAIVGIDTSSCSEALRFDRLWRDVCTEFLQAKMTLVWLPKNPQLEGQVLAGKIAFVAASNSYLKRKKEGTLGEAYRRLGGDPAPAGSCEPGPWQRGDSDPSRIKIPFDRPKPPVLSPAQPATAALTNDLKLDLAARHPSLPPKPASVAHDEVMHHQPEVDEDAMQVKEGSVFVTSFPNEVSAKDLGILFSQFGNIVAVDIYHVSATLPRFAYVAYSEPAAGEAALQALHQKPIDLETEFGRANHADLEIWRNWQGKLTVVKAEPPRLVPSSVAADFPDLPDWARGGKAEAQEAPTSQAPAAPAAVLEEVVRKRSREPEVKEEATPVKIQPSSPVSSVNSPSPHKRPRRESLPAEASAAVPAVEAIVNAEAAAQPVEPRRDSVASEVDSKLQASTSVAMPPYQPIVKTETRSTPPASTLAPVDPHAQIRPSPLPPTPNTAERPTNHTKSQSPAYGTVPTPTFSAQPQVPNGQGKPPLTNSAAEPIEHPIKIGAKTLRKLLQLVKESLPKHDSANWIAHSCLIATEIDSTRRGLQRDLYATDEAFLSGREFEKILSARGFTPARVDTFITKVLKVLDGIAMAEEGEIDESAEGEQEVAGLEQELEVALERYTEQTREAVHAGGRMMEYLVRGKELQEKKRLDIERRVKVLEGMSKIGDTVSAVVRFLLTEDK